MRYLLALLFLFIVVPATSVEYSPLVMGADGKQRQLPFGTDYLRVVPTYGTDAGKPAASATNLGMLYVATDTLKIYRSTGAGWSVIGAASGPAGGDLSGTYPNPTVIGAADNAFGVYDESDTSKRFALSTGAQTTTTTLTLNTGAQSASRQLSVPVLAGSDTVAVIGQGQTFAGVQTFSTPIASTSGGTGVNNAGTITNASNTTITGGGTVSLGGFTITVPATGTADLIGTAQTVTAAKTHTDAEVILRNTDNTTASQTHLRLERGTGSGSDATISTKGASSQDVGSVSLNVGVGTTAWTSNGNSTVFGGTVVAPTGTTSIASIQMPHGVAPSSPANGDMWTTTAGMYVRVNGATVGPLIDASSGGATTAFYAKISSATVISITSATTATINRMHSVEGTAADYTITMPTASTGDVVGFTVRYPGQASKQYKLDAGAAVYIAGRIRYLTLLTTNVALFWYNGAEWVPLVLSLETPWQSTTNTITAVTTNPTKGTVATDTFLWRRVGDSCEVRANYWQTTAGTAGSGQYRLGIPFGYDTAKVTRLAEGTSKQQADARAGLGTIAIQESGALDALGIVYANTSGTTYVSGAMLNGPGTAEFNWSSGSSPFSTVTFGFRAQFTYPVLDW